MMPSLETVSEWRLEADQNYKEGDYSTALKYYRKLTEAVPNEAELWFRMGNTYYRMGKTQEAIAAYKEALIRDRRMSKAWYNTGLNQLRESAQTFNESLNYLPQNDPLHEVSKAYAEQLLLLIETQNNRLQTLRQQDKPIVIEPSKVEVIVMPGKGAELSDEQPMVDQGQDYEVNDPRYEEIYREEPEPEAKPVMPGLEMPPPQKPWNAPLLIEETTVTGEQENTTSENHAQ